MPRYSRRLDWNLDQNAFSRLLEQKGRDGELLLDLICSNPTKVLTQYPHDEIRTAFSRLPQFDYEPDPFGLAGARQVISEFYRAQGLFVTRDRIALTASTSEAYGLLFKQLCDPGDEVLVPAPSYPLFEYLAACESVRLMPYQLRYDGCWFIDFSSLRAQISERTRAIVVVNPNNPTGSFLKRHELDALSGIALERGLPILADEVFSEYEFGTHEGRVNTLVDCDAVLSFSLNGLSKLAGMPQMKLAWMVINGPEREREAAHSRLELLLDTYLSVNTPVQLALEALLEIGVKVRKELKERARSNLESVRSLLAQSPVHVRHCEGGWSATLEFPHATPEEDCVMRLLSGASVVLQPGYFFDMPASSFGVASLITEEATFRAGMQRIADFYSTANACLTSMV